MRRNTVADIQSKLDKCVPTNGPLDTPCLIWSLGKFSNGYGVVTWNGKTLRAHRAAWQIKNGCIPDGMFVCHKCDTPACCNTDHMFIGTHADNVADRSRKGRCAKGPTHGLRTNPEKAFRGEQVAKSKLTNELVHKIMRIHTAKNPPTCAHTARQIGVDRNTVLRVVNGISWIHITARYRAAVAARMEE